MKIMTFDPKTIYLIIFTIILAFSNAQEDDPLGVSSSKALQRVQLQFGEYFADKVVEMRGIQDRSLRKEWTQPREWTIVVNDERSQFRLRTVRVDAEKSINEGDSSKFYPENLPIGFASSKKIKIDSTKAFEILIKEARAARIGFDYVNYKLRSLEFGDEPVWVLSAMSAKGVLLGQVIMSAYDANIFRTIWYYRGSRGYVKIVDSALDGLRKNETSDEVFPSPKINGETKIDNPVENPPPVNQPSPSVPSIEPGTEEAEVKPIGSN